jgi:glycerophosphoryl diester phosphodiesterase
MKFLLLFLPIFAYSQSFDVEGHRGCRGLMPENTIPAFIKAIDIGVTTLEMDLTVSKDSQLIVSHDPWISEDICVCQEKIAIQKLNASEIKNFDCGSKINTRFPLQVKMKVSKPLLSEVVDTVEKYIQKQQLTKVHYNMEIKSKPEWDGTYTPDVSFFAKLLVDFIHSHKMVAVTVVQSFDRRALEAVHKLDSTISTAWLFALPNGWKIGFQELSFKPTIMSSYSLITSKKQINKAHRLGMKVIPWTVNDTVTLQHLKTLGVDGIISDYPNLLMQR